jgi:hypothetical protein
MPSPFRNKQQKQRNLLSPVKIATTAKVHNALFSSPVRPAGHSEGGLTPSLTSPFSPQAMLEGGLTPPLPSLSSLLLCQNFEWLDFRLTKVPLCYSAVRQKRWTVMIWMDFRELKSLYQATRSVPFQLHIKTLALCSVDRVAWSLLVVMWINEPSINTIDHSGWKNVLQEPKFLF